MKQQFLALAALALVASACADTGSNPTQPSAGAPAALSAGRTNIMRVRGAQPAGGVSGQATGINYHGGPILAVTNVAAMYWGTAPIYTGGPTPGTSGTGAQDGSLIGHFLRNLGGSPYFNINTTYTDAIGGGHTVSNVVNYTQFWADNQNVPPSSGAAVSDASIQAEIIRGFTTGALTYDPQTIYLVFTAGKTNLGGGFGTQYCAYHGNFLWNGQLVIYAAQPDNYAFPTACAALTGSPNNDFHADAEVNTLAHEIEEATTDYRLDAWYDNFGAENADKCAWTFGTTYTTGNGATANMNLGGKDFLVQQNWVNAGNGGCLTSYGGVSNQPPVASFTWSCTGLACTFNGTGSSDPDGSVASYNWTISSGTSVSTASSFSRTFPSARTFTLTLTVTDNQGATNSTTQTITVTGGGSNQPPVASFTYSCTAAHACTFTSTSTDPDGTIASYAWKLAAGNTVSTAASFSKTFPSARTFALTLTVTDNGGASTSTTQTITVP